MDPNAVLGPVDPQLGEYPAASVLKVIEQKSRNRIDDQTWIMADISEKAIRQLKAAVQDILLDKLDAERAVQLAETLATGKWTHDYPLMVDEARRLGLPVTTDMPPEVYEFIALFPQPKQRVPSVQYIPAPVHHQREQRPQ